MLGQPFDVRAWWERERRVRRPDQGEKKRRLGGCLGGSEKRREEREGSICLALSFKFSPCVLLEFRKRYHLQNGTSGRTVTEDQYLWSHA